LAKVSCAYSILTLTNGGRPTETYKDGIVKGTGIRYTMAGPDTVRPELGALQRIE
jgi:hypothetical protein